MSAVILILTCLLKFLGRTLNLTPFEERLMNTPSFFSDQANFTHTEEHSSKAQYRYVKNSNSSYKAMVSKFLDTDTQWKVNLPDMEHP